MSLALPLLDEEGAWSSPETCRTPRRGDPTPRDVVASRNAESNAQAVGRDYHPQTDALKPSFGASSMSRLSRALYPASANPRRGPAEENCRQWTALGGGTDSEAGGSPESSDQSDDEESDRPGCSERLGSLNPSRFTSRTIASSHASSIYRVVTSRGGYSVTATGSLDDLGQVRRVHKENGEPLTWAEVLYLLQHDDEFCEALADDLRSAPQAGIFWEVIPVCRRTAAEQTFEFVILDAGGALSSARSNPCIFKQHISAGQDTCRVAVFPSEAGKVEIVAPCQNGPAEDYSHLVTFLRRGPPDQIRELWRQLGRAVEKRLAATDQTRSQPVWVSSHGMGMPWVHIRLDTSPRYFTYSPWKIPPLKQSGTGHSPASGQGSSRPSLPAVPPVQLLTSRQQDDSTVRRRLSHRLPSSRSQELQSFELSLEESPCVADSLLHEASLETLESVRYTGSEDTRSVSSMTDDLYACSEAEPLRGCFSRCQGLFRRRRRRPRPPRLSRTVSSSGTPRGPYSQELTARRQDLLAMAH